MSGTNPPIAHKAILDAHIIDVKKRFLRFYYLKKRVFNVFIFWNVFYFLVANFFYPTKPAKIVLNLLDSCIKRLFSGGFNMEAIQNSLMKSRSPQTLSCILGK